MIFEISLLIVLILTNAALAGTEMALVSLRESQLARLSMKGERGKRVVRLARDPNRFLSTVQIGLTLGGFLASAVAAVALAEPLVGPLGFLGNAAEAVSIVVVTLVLTFFTLVFGELAPKRIAMQRAEWWALYMCGPVSLLARASRPALWVLGRATDLVVRLAGADPNRQREDITTEEIRTMIDSQPDMTADQREIIAGAFDVQNRHVWSVIVPRVDVIAVLADSSADDTKHLLVKQGLSRAPVYGTDLDDIVGVVHIRDLIDVDGPTSAVMREPLVIPDSLSVLEALRRMRVERTHMAIVGDEFGGFLGIVTMEDLFEEIVGDIYDEFDVERRSIVREPDGSIVLEGNYPAHELSELGVFLPHDDAATIAGIVLATVGRIPSVGERINVEDWTIVTLAVHRNAVTKVRLVPNPA